MSFTVRPGTIDDAPAVSSVLNAVEEDRVLTVEGLTHFMRTVPERARRAFWAGEVGGTLVAWGAAGLTWESTRDDDGYASLVVHPEHRRQGLGNAIWELLDAHLESIGAARVSVTGQDEPDAHRFARARGFRETFRIRTSRLELASLQPPPELPEGIELRPFSSYAEDPRPVYELDLVLAQDIPLDQPIGEVEWDEWIERYWRHPMVNHDCSLVLLVDGVPVSYTLVATAAETGRANTGMTGTLREHRGRGYAELVKRHSLACCASLGLTVAFTENDETNAPMLAVNTRLGYRPSSTRVTFSRP
jgi:GNAT superfamily N-acetyltransferase